MARTKKTQSAVCSYPRAHKEPQKKLCPPGEPQDRQAAWADCGRGPGGTQYGQKSHTRQVDSGCLVVTVFHALASQSGRSWADAGASESRLYESALFVLWAYSADAFVGPTLRVPSVRPRHGSRPQWLGQYFSRWIKGCWTRQPCHCAPKEACGFLSCESMTSLRQRE